MNAWRWMGGVLLVAGLTTFGLSAGAQQKEKDAKGKVSKAQKTDKTDTSTDDKKEKTQAKTGEKKAEPAVGQGEITLKAFEAKEPFYQTLETTTNQKMTVMGMKHEQTQRQTFYFSWTPKEKKEGRYTVVQKILGVKMDIDIAGNKISYDSTAQQQAKNPMSEFFRQLVGAEFTLTISQGKDGRYTVEKVEGIGKLVDDLGKVNASMKPLLQRILTENTVKQMAEPMLGVVPPGGAIPKGGSWTSTNKLDMGPIGTYMTTNTYTAEGKGKGVLPIKVDTQLKYTKPAESEKGNLPFTIKEADLKSSKQSTGTIEFSIDKGRVESADLTVELEGSLKIDIANMDTTVELSQKQVSKLRTSDKNPVGSAK